MDPLEAISPIDGRYYLKTKSISSYFSEMAIFRYRLLVEVEYLIALSQNARVIRIQTASEKNYLRSIVKKFNLADAQKIKEIEKSTNHDVKAVEYYLKEKIDKTSLKDVQEMLHFGLTSDDINNLAYNLAFKDFLQREFFPLLENLTEKIKELVKTYADQPMLARTHGQPALPTTFGKEMAVFYQRIKDEVVILKNLKIKGKLTGAVGNFNAHVLVFPEINWLSFSEKFVSLLGLEPDLVTTQIESYDSLIRCFDSLKRINTILIGLCQDLWRYVSDDYLKQKIVEKEVGSSTLPQKVNPIFFENAEGNLGLANSFFRFYAEKLPISRLQRDLSDSAIRRTFGEPLALTMLSYANMIEGLSRINVNKEKMAADLESHWEIVTEGIQSLLRHEGEEKPYERLKSLVRGKTLSRGELKKFINSLNLKKETKKKLRKLTPLTYLGLAQKIAKLCLKEV